MGRLRLATCEYSLILTPVVACEGRIKVRSGFIDEPPPPYTLPAALDLFYYTFRAKPTPLPRTPTNP